MDIRITLLLMWDRLYNKISTMFVNKQNKKIKKFYQDNRHEYDNIYYEYIIDEILCHASQWGNTKIIKFLFESNIQHFTSNFPRLSEAFGIAASYNRINVIKFFHKNNLIKNGGFWNVGLKNAIREKRKRVIKYILNHGKGFIENIFNWSIIDIKIIKLILKHGCGSEKIIHDCEKFVNKCFIFNYFTGSIKTAVFLIKFGVTGNSDFSDYFWSWNQDKNIEIIRECREMGIINKLEKLSKIIPNFQVWRKIRKLTAQKNTKIRKRIYKSNFMISDLANDIFRYAGYYLKEK